MHSEIERLQEFEKWKCHTTSVVAGVFIKDLIVISVPSTSSTNPFFELTATGPIGSWRLLRRKNDVLKFSLQIEKAFPLEAGLRGHPRYLPSLQMPTRWTLFWKSDRSYAQFCARRVSRFFEELLFMSPYISRSRCVLEFLLPWANQDPQCTLLLMGHRPSYIKPNFRESESTRMPITAASVRMKFRYGDETIAIDIDTLLAMDYSTVLDNVSRKLSIDRASLRLLYVDSDNDTVEVRCLEDIFAAIAMGHTKLILVTK